MYEGITVEPQFADFFLRKLIGKQNSLNDLRSLDEGLYKQLNFVKTYSEGPVEDMMLTFQTSDEDHVTGEAHDVDLIPNGSETTVNDHNKFRYIYMVADYRLNKRIQRQSEAFVAGFHECIPMQWLSIYSEREV
jgi:ubiquitin-protein ligase E3 C